MKISRITVTLAACLMLSACVSRETKPSRQESVPNATAEAAVTGERSTAEEIPAAVDESDPAKDDFAEKFGADKVFSYMAGDESCAVLYGNGTTEQENGTFRCETLSIGLYSYGEAKDSQVIGTDMELDPARSGIHFYELWGGTLYIPYFADDSGVSAQFWASKGGGLALFTGDYSYIGGGLDETVKLPEFAEADHEHDSLTDSDGNVWRFDFTAGKYYVFPGEKPQGLPPVQYAAAYSYSTSPVVVSCELDSSGMTEEQTAQSALDILAEKYLQSMMDESYYREFRILEYKDIAAEIFGRTDEVYTTHLQDYKDQDENNIWKSLENWEISESSWLVNFSAKYRVEGRISEYTFTADANEWYDAPADGAPPACYMLYRSGDTWYLWSRAAYRYFPSGDNIAGIDG